MNYTKITLTIAGLLIGLNIFSQTIENLKLDSAILQADRIIENDPRQFFKNVESIIIYSQDKIRFEKYYNGFDKDSLHHIQSQTKSIVALLTGIAIDKGFIKSENEPVSMYFPEYFNRDSLKSLVTIKDLLTMSAGFEWEELTPVNARDNDNMKMFQSGDWLRYALESQMAVKPSTVFRYNSGCPMIVAGIVEKATRMKLDQFANRYLFIPLGINQYRWLKDSTGFCHAGGGLFLKPSDMMKIGIMVMNYGKWEDHELISEMWINKTLDSYLATSFDSSTYGYFWWLRTKNINYGRSTRVVSAEGAGGQNLYIFPEYKLIVAFTEHNYNTPQVSQVFIRESILPLLE